MKVANRKGLVILNNAPSYTRGDLDPTKIKLLMLPQNTTSKIQPMDARIIAAFKRRYRHRQLQDALDKEECNEVDICRVDQLNAMERTKAAWAKILAAIVANCLLHTGLFNVQENNVNVVGEMEEEEAKRMLFYTIA